MTTGAEFAKFTNKKISGFEDFSARLLGYLRTLHSENLSKLFQEGSFDESMGLSSPGADQVRVDAKATVPNDFDCHDGAGHILDLDSVLKSVLFENTAATTYEVGAGFVEKPVGIAVNPRTGKPDYLKLVEDVGDQADPDTVTDNGNGTITLRVDALFESGVAVADNTGRIVRVFKRVPADNALTEGVAIEEPTVFFGGGQNQITTVGSLGQGTISTTAADYIVQLSGVTVRKNTATNKPSTSGKHFFAGTVLGNGGTPTVFDVSGQFVLKSQAANQITFLPHEYVTSIDVQSAIEELIDDLQGTALPGSSKIGVEDGSFDQAVMSSGDSGGLGTVVTTQAALQAANDQLLRRRVMTTTMADGTTRTKADIVGTNAIDSIGLLGSTAQRGGRYYLNRGDYEFSSLSSIPQGFPEVIGEEGGDSFGTMPTVEINGSPGTDFSLRGIWRRIYFRSRTADNSRYKTGGDGLGHGVFEQCHFESGGLRASSNGTNPKNATIFRGCRFEGKANGNNLDGIEIDDTDSVDQHWLIFDGCYFSGPDPAQSALGATGFFHDIGILSGANLNAFLERGMIEFRNCKFENRRTDSPTLRFEDVRHNVRFVDCLIHGGVDSTEATIEFTAASVEDHSIMFVRCVVTTDTGRAFNDLRVNAGSTDHGGYSIIDCDFYGGEDTTTIADPQFFNVGSGIGATVVVLRNVYLQPGAAGTRASGSTKPMCELGGGDGNNDKADGAIDLDGLFITMGGSASAHNMPTLVIHGTESATTGTRHHKLSNIHVDLDANRLSVAASGVITPADVEVTGSSVAQGATLATVIDNLEIVDWGTRSGAADTGKSVLVLDNAVVNDLRMRQSTVEASPTEYNSIVRMTGSTGGSDKPSGVNGFYIQTGGGNFVDCNVAYVVLEAHDQFIDHAQMDIDSANNQIWVKVESAADNASLEDVRGPKDNNDFHVNDQFIVGVAGADRVRIRDAHLDLSTQPEVTLRLIDIPGKYASIIGCTIRADANTQPNFIRAAGVGSNVSLNTLIDGGGGTVPTAITGGTDSQNVGNVRTLN